MCTRVLLLLSMGVLVSTCVLRLLSAQFWILPTCVFVCYTVSAANWLTFHNLLPYQLVGVEPMLQKRDHKSVYSGTVNKECSKLWTTSASSFTRFGPFSYMYYCFSDEPISVCSVRVSMEHDSSLFRELASLPASVWVQFITLTPRQPCATVKSISTGSRHPR